jgi:hypothetical protein
MLVRLFPFHVALLLLVPDGTIALGLIATMTDKLWRRCSLRNKISVKNPTVTIQP